MPDLIVFGDLHGDYLLCKTLLQDLGIARQDAKKQWEWLAGEHQTVVCLGDFVDRYRPQIIRPKLTTQEAIADERAILTAFRALIKLAPKHESHFIVLLGNHELYNLLDQDQNYSHGVRDPENKAELALRQTFIQSWLKPFVLEMNCGLAVQWANYLLCHGGAEIGWFRRHHFQDIPSLNRYFRKNLRYSPQYLDIFMEPDSLILSRKVALEPDVWRQEDKLDLEMYLNWGPYPFKMVVGHTTTPVIQTETLGVRQPQCQHAREGSILSSQDNLGQDDLYYVDVAGSDAFFEAMMPPSERFARRPQALVITVETNEAGQLLYSRCAVRALDRRQFTQYDQEHWQES